MTFLDTNFLILSPYKGAKKDNPRERESLDLLDIVYQVQIGLTSRTTK